MIDLIQTVFVTMIFCTLFERFIIGFLHFIGFYAIIQERETRVYVLFGEIIGVVDEPGFHFLWGKVGVKGLFVNWIGHAYSRSSALDQKYIRSIPVNSEEGTPMGIGAWYEMFISDPVAHIFKNVDPQGSLEANVKNATIKTLSNLPLLQMLVNRHQMSGVVREEVTPDSSKWGYKLGSVYIRKVHFRDENMIKQIEEKVVNQLRQVTSAIEQDGKNQVNVIASKAEQESSSEFAKAAAVRPTIVAETLKRIGKDPKIMATMFDILEAQRIIEGTGELTVMPEGSKNKVLDQLVAAGL